LTISASTVLTGSNDHLQIALSVLAAVSAAYAVLDFAGRISAAHGWPRAGWLAGTAAAIGSGVAATHFVGMLAFRSPASIGYDWQTGLASLLAGIVSSALVLHIASRQKMGHVQAWIASVLMGGGTATRHYLGMAAMRWTARRQPDPRLVVLSVVLAVMFSLGALWLTSEPQAQTRGAAGIGKMAGAVALGAAISTLHYTGVAAVSFLRSEVTPDLLLAVGARTLGSAAIGSVTLLILGLAVFIPRAGRRLADQSAAPETERNVALSESEGRFRSLVEALPDAIFVVVEEQIVFVNPRGVSLLGARRPEQIIGKNLSEIIHPDSMASIRHRMRECHRTGVAAPAKEHAFIALDGSRVDIESAAIPVTWKGKAAIEAICRDIRERKRVEEALRKSEERFRLAAQAGKMFAYEWDTATDEILRSAEAAQVLGIDAAVHVSGHDILTRVHPDDRDRLVAAVAELSPDRPDLRISYRMTRPDGELVWLLRTSRAHFDEQGRMLRVVGMVADVTERMRAERALVDTEQRFRQLAESIREVFYLTAVPGHRFLYVSPAYEQVWGRTCQSLYEDPQSFLTAIHPEDRDIVRHAFGNDDPRMHEYRILRPDGGVRWIWDRGFPICDEKGQVYRFAGLAEDITERKQTEQSLRLFRELIDQSHDAIMVIDPETLRFIDINGRACLDLGYAREELLSMSVYDIDPTVDESMYRRVQEELQDSGFTVFETLHRRKDGSTFPVEVSVKQVRLDRMYRVCVARDITERKRAEQTAHEWQKRLELAEKAGLRIGLWDWDLIANTVIWSDETCRQWGYTSDTFSGRVADVVDRIHPEDRLRVEEAIRRILAGRAEYAEQFRVVRPDGTICWIDAHGVVIRNGSPHMLGIGIDITDLKKSEQSLQQARMDLTRVARIATMGELTASIAHEINQPLAAAVTNASASVRWLAAQPPNLVEARAAMTSVVQDADRASCVIKKIRALLTKTPSELQPVDMNEVVREVLALARSDLMTGSVTVHSELSDCIAEVLGDRVQLQQVILNLIMNAIDAMTTITGRPRTMRIESADDAEGILVRIQDSGKGLDPEQASRIFESFFTTKPDGIGMGLSISRSIVEAHGGRLWATPGSPHGAVFQLVLPKADANT